MDNLKSFILKVIRTAVYIIAKIDPKLPATLEIDLKKMQGKGSGAESFRTEAKVALGFLTACGISNPIVLDVGANVGRYSESILDLSPRSMIFAFEPSSAARSKLKERFEGSTQVNIVPLALSDINSTETLWSDMAGSGLASLTKRRLDHFGIDFDVSEQVSVSTLDTWIETTKVIPDLIKIDVEGHELNVLKGGLAALSLSKVVQFEFGGCNIDTRTFFQDFWYLFTDAGFAIYRIANSKPIRILTYSEEDEYFRTTNFLAVKK